MKSIISTLSVRYFFYTLVTGAPVIGNIYYKSAEKNLTAVIAVQGIMESADGVDSRAALFC